MEKLYGEFLICIIKAISTSNYMVITWQVD